MKNEEFILSTSENVPERPSAVSRELTCVECGRQFFVGNMDKWVYKLLSKGHTSWYCRWNCVRAGERKIEEAKTGRMKELKSKKPSKEKLEDHLRAGATIANIAKKYEASTQSVHNWIKSYGLAGIQGVKKPKDEPVIQHAPPVNNTPPAQETSPNNDMIQHSPTQAEIEQFHTDTEVQELPGMEMYGPVNVPGQGLDEPPDPSDEEYDRIMATVEVPPVDPTWKPITHESSVPESITSTDPVPALRRNFEEVWQDAKDDITQLRIMYDQQADDDFRDQLLKLVLAVTKGRGLIG